MFCSQCMPVFMFDSKWAPGMIYKTFKESQRDAGTPVGTPISHSAFPFQSLHITQPFTLTVGFSLTTAIFRSSAHVTSLPKQVPFFIRAPQSTG